MMSNDIVEMVLGTLDKGRTWINDAEVIQVETTVPTLIVMGIAAVAVVSVGAIAAYRALSDD